MSYYKKPDKFERYIEKRRAIIYKYLPDSIDKQRKRFQEEYDEEQKAKETLNRIRDIDDPEPRTIL